MKGSRKAKSGKYYKPGSPQEKAIGAWKAGAR